MMSTDRSTTPERAHFVARAARKLSDANVEYVVLHGESGSGDTDLDVAVTRASLATVDALARNGELGRLVLAVEYDSPWSRTYVFRSPEEGRRYRQLDVSCDPLGVGRDAGAAGVALRSVREQRGIRVATPAARVIYLSAKRALKRTCDVSDLEAAFAADPLGSKRLLAQTYGDQGGALAAALAAGQPPLDALAQLRRSLVRPTLRRRLVRATFELRRTLTRLVRPTGVSVAVVGPDGVGKSVLARALAEESADLFRRCLHLHFRPGLLPPLGRFTPRPADDSTTPHATPPSGPLVSLLRVVYLWLDFSLGWWFRVAAPKRRTSLVVIERGWLDLLVDPRRYRVHRVLLPLLRVLTRFVPRPDVIVVLRTDATTVRARKAELDEHEIVRQAAEWSSLATADAARFRTIDASATKDQVLAETRDVIDDVLARRERSLVNAAVATRVLGGFAVGGVPYRALSRNGHTRWFVPEQTRLGPRASCLYRPGRTLDRLASGVADALVASGIPLGAPVSLDTSRGAAEAVRLALERPRIDLAAAAPHPLGRRQRALLCVLEDGAPLAYVKVARSAAQLAREARILEQLSSLPLPNLRIPRVLAVVPWEEFSLLVVEALSAGSSTNRRIGPHELAALMDYSAHASVLGGGAGVLCHGDFTPWNSSAQRDGRLALWDWEDARHGLPFEDLFHWEIRRNQLFGNQRAGDVLASALSRQGSARALAARTGWSVDLAEEAFAAVSARLATPETLGTSAKAVAA